MSEDWVTPGRNVAIMRSDWRQTKQAPKYSAIAKVGKRDVVLDDGQRFNVKHLNRREGGTWGWTVQLLPIDANVVAEAQALHDHARVVWKAEQACEEFRFHKGISAADVILALAPLTGVAEEIDRLFAPTPAQPRPTRPVVDDAGGASA